MSEKDTPLANETNGPPQVAGDGVGGVSDSSPTVDYLCHPFVVERERFERVSGLKIHPDVLRLKPQGHRVLVVLNPPPAEYEGIYIPETVRELEKMGSGWVLSCGPLVGMPGTPHPGAPVCAPEELLYKQVIFGATMGKITRVDFLDREVKSKYITLTDRDIWHVDENPSEFLAEEG